MIFYKMHGTGNDFVIIENLKEEELNYSVLAKTFCNRHFGIGADGLIVLLPSREADFKMRIFNGDGSEAEMCGNGIRCLARHIYEKGYASTEKFRIETRAGIIVPECAVVNGKVEKVRVDMGRPRYGDLHPKAGEFLTLSAQNLMIKLKLDDNAKGVEGGTVSMGNPHYVIFKEKGDPWNLEEHGKLLSLHPEHPHQSNVEFVEILGPSRLRVKVWERGVGPTQACGTGACAVMAAARILKGMPEKIEVEMPGGLLEIEWDGKGAIYMSGAARYVFEGKVSDELLPEDMKSHLDKVTC